MFPELMMLQTDKISEAEGVDSESRKANTKITKQVFNFMYDHSEMSKDDLRKGLTEILSEGFEMLPAEEKEGESHVQSPRVHVFYCCRRLQKHGVWNRIF